MEKPNRTEPIVVIGRLKRDQVMKDDKLGSTYFITFKGKTLKLLYNREVQFILQEDELPNIWSIIDRKQFMNIQIVFERKELE